MDFLPNGQSWAIRNSGTMLLKALIGRLTNGYSTTAVRISNKHRPYAKATHERFPELSSLIFDLLEKSVKLIDGTIDEENWNLQYEIGFPALQIISHVGVVPEDRDRVKFLLMKHLESRIWNIRVQAARALSVLIDGFELFDYLGNVLLQPIPSTNLVHGYLQCVQEYLNIRPYAAKQSLIQLLTLARRLLTRFACLYVLKIYLQTICQAVRLYCEVQQAVTKIGMERTEELSLHEAQTLFQDSLRQLVEENLPQDIIDALTCTDALLKLCDLPMEGTGKTPTYPYLHAFSTLEDIPSPPSIQQAIFNSSKADIDESLTSSLELLEASQEGTAAEDCNQARDHVTVLLSSRTSIPSSITQVPVSPPVFLDQLKRIKSQLDRIFQDKYPVEDLARLSQLDFCGAALLWMHRLDPSNTTLHSQYMLRYLLWLRLALQEDSVRSNLIYCFEAHMIPRMSLTGSRRCVPCGGFVRYYRWIRLILAGVSRNLRGFYHCFRPLMTIRRT